MTPQPTVVVIDRVLEVRCRLASDTDDPRDCFDHAGKRYKAIPKYETQEGRIVISLEWSEAPYVVGYVFQ